jgi:hypothetical protein
MTSTLKLALAAASALVIAVPAHAATSLATFAYSGGLTTTLLLNGTTTLTATSRGWVSETGSNNGGGASANYLAGRCGSSDLCAGDDKFFNNYFVFNLGTFTGGTITSAVLQLQQNGSATQPGYISPTPSLTYTLWDSSIAAASMPGTGTIAFYDDLGSGTAFGSTVVTAATNGTIVGISFNATGLAALNAAGRNAFGFGGSINAAPGAVPESATWMMMIAGFGIVGGAMRRRQRTIVSFG